MGLAIQLSASTVQEYLRTVGLIPYDGRATVSSVAGGVSNVVLSVSCDGRRMIVKQALARLNVAEDWYAPIERTVNEGRALTILGEITPSAVPPVLHLDERNCILVIGHAKPHWRDWKSDLLVGVADPRIAEQLGRVLIAWQKWSPDVDAHLEGHEGFRALRLEPYYDSVAERLPALSEQVGRLRDELDAAAVCLVHGDFSPKNVLVGDDGVWVIDAEVAHIGHPIFDPAFLINHFLLKAIHRSITMHQSRQLVEAFWNAYTTSGAISRFSEAELGAQLGALLLSRSIGRSPAEYLTEAERLVTVALGSELLSKPPAALSEVIELTADMIRHHA